MDCRLCSVCRRLSKVSLLVAVVLASLVLSPMMVSSKELKEELCALRPTVFPVQQSGFKPHHIELHRCLGTCDPNLPPSHKSCIAFSVKEISLKLTSMTSQETKYVKVLNHTSCGCQCSISCTESEIPADGCGCKKLQGPSLGQLKSPSSNSEGNVLPYQIAIAIVGLFAVCILTICMIMHRNDDGVLTKLRRKCCKTDPQNRAKDGTHSSNKEAPNGTVV
ncbi:PREDICTED: uncharacterized protein LOC107354738 isoform X1 [Acropora digitifera]|uniref:uncharacterized protein LOC107354738 isoform X1 n=2 Tax=Acropora digitifera TaxID=70779 RepID=UPI00077B16F9|nr:PREDICTED: uncharacterized protein LOC107354738 isoform X1 [Acropora digitifera]XP_015776711.1 PREDICTED: uncharacterized protein LOC107354738 isoform X1 [Acropora digitifera]XP_015776712.1 PREDICTED: uncharacterized protein LOC107354738 isoform X1 [Acropora digitifera]